MLNETYSRHWVYRCCAVLCGMVGVGVGSDIHRIPHTYPIPRIFLIHILRQVCKSSSNNTQTKQETQNLRHQRT